MRALFWSAVAAAFTLLATSSTAQTNSLDQTLVEPNLVDIGGGHRLHWRCVGSGSPTVVFNQGGEGSIANWRRVQSAISAKTRTCFYDRSGFGWSDPPKGAIDALSVTDELHALLAKTRTKGPLVLVGHSIGGFYATVYADRFPRRVAGMVLVDAGFADQVDFADDAEWTAWLAVNAKGEQQLLDCAAKARAGELSADDLKGCFRVPKDLTPVERAYVLNPLLKPHWYEAEAEQSRTFLPRSKGRSLSSIQEEKVRRNFGDMPLVVLTAGHPTKWPDRTEASLERENRLWTQGHVDLAKRSTIGSHRVVADARHFIQLDNPQAVIDAVSCVVDSVRAPRQEPC
ncbi:alpha/beta hydrolase [Caulobacter segnis]|uniref:alpha/beta fold hydrolase n=1 Tax=Caulobacter segnis TaxID=88688 RepID=UPI00240EF719|nr:alpha/beta hydrolase [Caulobacter segnis]MDG2521904.1 alpha/beta hydrolase [Caulobacter segnis]